MSRLKEATLYDEEMRIAFSGAHYTGKSSLIKAAEKKLPGYEIFEEPYWILSEQGWVFSDPPTVEEFEQQLDCLINLIEHSPPNALFDRSPIDFFAYALAVGDGDVDRDQWEKKIEKVMPSLDLLVFVPLENPDRIPIPASEDNVLRLQVDEKLHELIVEDCCGIMMTKLLEVKGSLDERLKQLCSQIK